MSYYSSCRPDDQECLRREQAMRSQNSACSIPTCNQSVRVPHHIYTVHTEPVIYKSLEHNVQYYNVPATQEVRQTQHPTREVCKGDRCGSYGGGYHHH